MSSGVALPPGTPIFGIVYSDGSMGAWQRDRSAVVEMIRDVRELGLTPMFLVRLRMKAETLWAEE